MTFKIPVCIIFQIKKKMLLPLPLCMISSISLLSLVLYEYVECLNLSSEPWCFLKAGVYLITFILIPNAFPIKTARCGWNEGVDGEGWGRRQECARAQSVERRPAPKALCGLVSWIWSSPLELIFLSLKGIGRQWRILNEQISWPNMSYLRDKNKEAHLREVGL